ncbi:hypothetical protein HYDPIDRAFT_177608 [Hydnomerulius pinastri MD-312]|uniref:HIT-type domain-containing protein n=1 Tax=Hydnomerulius pinastri MD-312 TaxID=994086 RepID=A0A0C9W277_9AGAM|nr:hypothetical protein HYDPIDRAFT_177608 [Hydnomerulius pinastri MD-312]
MPPRSRPVCQVCRKDESKYSCSSCRANYCSVACYKEHKVSPPTDAVEDPKPLRPLTSLNWPYVPEESAYPDPLKRDDPKPLQLPQYEAIATSAHIRDVLASNPRLSDLLTNIDRLRGPEREEALQRALGVESRQLKNDLTRPQELDEDTRALRMLAEAVEGAVRGGKEGALGLDWDD